MTIKLYYMVYYYQRKQYAVEEYDTPIDKITKIEKDGNLTIVYFIDGGFLSVINDYETLKKQTGK